MKTFEQLGITGINYSIQGDQYTTCPKCSNARNKKNDKCLSVNIEKGVYNCHHCGSFSGSIYEKEEEDVKIEYSFKSVDEKTLKYFESRGISKETLDKMDISNQMVFMPRENKECNAIAFPYYKEQDVVNIKYRDAKKNFTQKKGGKKIFYNFNSLKNNDGTLIITEGEMDTLSLIECGFSYVVSVPDGAPNPDASIMTQKFSFLESAEKYFEKINAVYLAVDNDAPGFKLKEELARRIGLEKCFFYDYPDKIKDVNEMLIKKGKDFTVDFILNQFKPFPMVDVVMLNDVSDYIDDYYNFGDESGVGTGWNNLDEYYTVRMKELNIITGIPNYGKSEFLDSLTLNLAINHGYRAAIYSPENYPIKLHYAKLAHKYIGKPFFKYYRGIENKNRMTFEEHLKAKEFINEHYYWINTEEVKSIDDIMDRFKLIIYRKGANICVIDPWNRIEHLRDKGKSETEYIAEVLSKLSSFARNYNVAVYMVAHPKQLAPNVKSGKLDPPNPYQISGSAHWYNISDNILVVHREFDDVNTTSIHIKKIRFPSVGYVGVTSLYYDVKKARYYDAPTN